MRQHQSDAGRSDSISERGFSLLEMAVASALFAAMIGVVLSLMSMGQRSVGTGIARTQLEGGARQLLEQIANDLRGAQLQPFAGGSSEAHEISFKRRYGSYSDGLDDFDLTTSTVRWDQLPIETFRLVLESDEVVNSIDDNGNGLADECQLVKDVNGVTTVLCRGVPSGGLTFRLVSPRKLLIDVTLEAMDARADHLVATANTLVFLRN